MCSGKSTLVDRLCNMSGSKGSRTQSVGGKYLLSGCSLEYRFLDVQDDETDGEWWALIRIMLLGNIVDGNKLFYKLTLVTKLYHASCNCIHL